MKKSNIYRELYKSSEEYNHMPFGLWYRMRTNENVMDAKDRFRAVDDNWNAYLEFCKQWDFRASSYHHVAESYIWEKEV